MKKTFNKIILGLLSLSLLFVIFPYTSLTVMASGGGGTNPPPAERSSEISLIVNLDKEFYFPSETMIVSGSLLRTVCTNSVTGTIIDGYIPGVNPYYITIWDSDLAGGTIAPFAKNYTTPSTAGDYIMKIRVRTFSLPYYFVNEEGYFYYTAYTLNELIDMVETNTDYNYSAGPNKFIHNSNGKELDVNFVAAGTQVLNSVEIDLPFTMVVPPTPTISVKVLKSGESVPSSKTTINQGESADITWSATGLDASKAKCYRSDKKTEINYPGVGYTLKVTPSETTTYTIVCNDEGKTPANTPTLFD